MLGAIRRKIRGIKSLALRCFACTPESAAPSGGNLFLDLVRVQGRNPGSAVLAPEDGLVTAMSVVGRHLHHIWIPSHSSRHTLLTDPRWDVSACRCVLGKYSASIPQYATYSHSHCVKACTSGITISSRGRSGVVDADALQLGGTGTVAVCSYGQGVTLELESGAQ